MFEDYAVIPLDVAQPPVDPDSLRRFVQTYCEKCAFTRNRIRYVAFNARKPVLAGTTFLHACDPRFYAVDESTAFTWDPVFQHHFGALCAWFEELPFQTLLGLTLVTQTADIPEHLDIFGAHNSVTYYEAFRAIEPQFYRVVFTDPGDDVARNQAFYVTLRYGHEKRFVTLPEGTSAFALASSTCYHGAVHRAGHFKSTAALYGVLDRPRHLSLLRRSLARFDAAAIRLDAPGPVDGPGAEMPYRGGDPESEADAVAAH
jgi:hypothetical protein